MKQLLSKVIGEDKLTLLLFRYPFLQVMLFSLWFRLALLILALLLISVVLLLARIWTSTPPGFEPAIKVRGLHLVQSWSLGRAARKAEAQGKLEAAITAWQTAMVNNPGNAGLMRSYLQVLLKSQRAKPQLSTIVGPALWLLRLTHTNQADLELAVQVLQKHRINDLVLAMLETRENRLNPALEAIYLKSLFNTGQLQRFGSQWDRVAAGLSQDPELKLYHAAYQAGWRSGAAAMAGQKELEAMQENPVWRESACRLTLGVCWNLKDVARYAKTLQRLQSLKADLLADHVPYWRLLADTGRKAEAIRLAQACKIPPQSAGEAILFARICTDLGLHEPARSFLQQYAPVFGYSEPLWVMCANLLRKDERWSLLTALVLQIRQDKVAADYLTGYSYFLEGLAQRAQHNHAAAVSSFRRIPDFNFNNPYLAMDVAHELENIEHPEIAKELLLKLQKQCTNNVAYWELLQSVAADLKLPELRLTAAQEAYRLKPDDWITMNNYAAALITVRQQPEEAVRLTVQLLAHWPDEDAIKINHSMALLANRRTQEATQLLLSVTPARLSALEAHWFYVAWLEACLDLHNDDQARQAIKQINPKWLFPNQLKWLEQARKELAAKSPGS